MSRCEAHPAQRRWVLALAQAERRTGPSRAVSWTAALLQLKGLRDAVCFNITAGSCQKARQWRRSISLFEEMPQRGVRTDLVSLNTLAFTAWRGALLLLEAAAVSQLQQDQRTFNAPMVKGHWRLAPHLVSRMAREALTPDLVSHSRCLAAPWRLSFHHLGRLGRPDVVCWGAATAAAQWVQALRVLARMASLAVRPDMASFGAAAQAAWRWATALLEDLRWQSLRADRAFFRGLFPDSGWHRSLALLGHAEAAGLPSDAAMLSSCMRTCGEAGWPVALHLAWHGRLDQIGLGAALAAFASCQQWQRALLLLTESPVLLDEVSFNSALAACEKASQWLEAMELFQLMQRSQVAPSATTYSSAIKACGNVSRWAISLALLEEMKDAGVLADAACYNSAMGSQDERGWSWWRALALFAGGFAAPECSEQNHGPVCRGRSLGFGSGNGEGESAELQCCNDSLRESGAVAVCHLAAGGNAARAGAAGCN
ncbi:unnamed protein product [Effrenium voratum]|nr:unnamed protein product [Effrenium voratum]